MDTKNNSDVKKILIAEDEHILSEMYTEVFRAEGFEVVTADSGEEAIEVTIAEQPDFILLDILLLGEDGVTFLRRKKDNPKIADIPVLAFSNFDDAETKREALQLGAKAYLIKTSYTPQQVIQQVKKYLE